MTARLTRPGPHHRCWRRSSCSSCWCWPASASSCSSAACSPRPSTSRSSSGPTRSPPQGEDAPRALTGARATTTRSRRSCVATGRGARVERQRRRRRARGRRRDPPADRARSTSCPHEDERLPRAGRPGRPASVVIVGSPTRRHRREHRDASALARSSRSRSCVAGARRSCSGGWSAGRCDRSRRSVPRSRRSAARDLHRRVPVPPGDDEVARLARTMNDMLERVDDAAQRQRRFVADASHELRSPLTRIRTELEVDLAHPDAGRPARDPRQRARRDDRAPAPRRRPAPRRPRRRGRTSARCGASPSTSTTSCSASPAACAPTTACGSTSRGVGAGRVLGDPDQLTRARRATWPTTPSATPRRW